MMGLGESNRDGAQRDQHPWKNHPWTSGERIRNKYEAESEGDEEHRDLESLGRPDL